MLFHIFLFLSLPALSAAQALPKSSDFRVSCDSLQARLDKYMGAVSEVKIKKVITNSGRSDFYFSDELSFYPWRDADLSWFSSELQHELDTIAPGCRVGRIFTKGQELKDWTLPSISADGNPVSNGYRCSDPRSASTRFIERERAPRFSKGLADRYIALWQSHGLYYNVKDSLWHWQRAALHRTVEDMFTQSYVLPLLIPMLENSGAYVMTPRERDIQTNEVICDGDQHFASAGKKRCRTHGKYEESGGWSSAGTGFADLKLSYGDNESPFSMGSCRQSPCHAGGGSEARWTPIIPERGRYAVYISYRSLPNSTTSARYTVHHMGGESVFKVNQKRGGGTWIYLGTFEFGKGDAFWVSLDNSGPEGSVVTADAVRFGGGYGKTRRGGEASGKPAYMEGALYSMPWYGIDPSVYTVKDNDYKNDIVSRGQWVNWMKEVKSIPFDLSLAFHTDAGVMQRDSTVGTLAIHTLFNEGSRKYSDGSDRMKGRLLADMVQTQVVGDIRAQFDPEWNRRGIWNKLYAESRLQDVPSMLLELLSHQNYADMKFGEDPAFKFTVCRAVYKGVLKFLSAIYGCQYEVQPLPVNSFAAVLDGNRAVLSWKPSLDTLETTADPHYYVVYTRIDDGAFDDGIRVDDNSYVRTLKPGHIYSFRVTACNEGGSSFPSQTLSLGRPQQESGLPVLIVNDFDRVGAPYGIESDELAGFMANLDSGVPYVNDISYVGENYEFHRESPWVSDDEPGFGASNRDKAGMIVAGNTFDFPLVHGRVLMELGHPFCSMSREAFTSDVPAASEYKALDLICGKQSTTRYASGRISDRYQVFSEELKSALCVWTANGGDIMVSGSAIASDPSSGGAFTKEVLGFGMASSNASGCGKMLPARMSGLTGEYSFRTSPNEVCYSIEAPDGLKADGIRSRVLLRYEDTGIPASVLFVGNGYKVFSLGVPLECITGDGMQELMSRALKGM